MRSQDLFAEVSLICVTLWWIDMYSGRQKNGPPKNENQFNSSEWYTETNPHCVPMLSEQMIQENFRRICCVYVFAHRAWTIFSRVLLGCVSFWLSTVQTECSIFGRTVTKTTLSCKHDKCLRVHEYECVCVPVCGWSQRRCWWRFYGFYIAWKK